MPKITTVNSTNKFQQTKSQKNSSTYKNKNFQIAKEGILVDNFIKEDIEEQKKSNVNFDKICDNLMISPSQFKENSAVNNSVPSFSMRKAITPLLVGTLAAFGGIASLSSILLKSSKALKDAKCFEKLPDLARNMNIRQEPQFATYRALRDPSVKNIAGAVGVFLYSGLTIVAKNFVDGFKEIWVKKQQADIERDLQEQLIEVETKSFAGKINASNQILIENANYFKKVIGERTTFNGKNLDNVNQKDKKNNLKFLLMSLGVVAATIATAKITAVNIKKALNNANDFTNDFTNNAINAIEKMSKEKNPDLKRIEELFQIINAKPDYINDTLKTLNLPKADIEKIIKSVDEGKKTLFANAPTALGGIPEKIQYYCYIDEDRGHLYNLILNPENKFLRAIFLSFATISAVGYIAKQGFDALKEVAVLRENAKTELNLKKRLVEVEVDNFTSKKKAAVMPMIDNFNKQLNSEKSVEELTSSAENILLEIKNGPPYIFG